MYSQYKVSRNSKPTTNNLVYIWDSSLICTKFHLSSSSYMRKPGRWQAPPTKKTEVQQCFLKWHVAPVLPVSLLPHIKRLQAWALLSPVATPTAVLVRELGMSPMQSQPSTLTGSVSAICGPLNIPHCFGENWSLYNRSPPICEWNISLITQLFLITSFLKVYS